MPSFIVKVEPERDFYCLWSTIVDCPHVWGTKEELQKDNFYGQGTFSDERFERADKTGTSSHDGFFGWDDDEFFVHNMGPTPGRLKRSDLGKFLESIKSDDDFDHSLLTPFEDDE